MHPVVNRVLALQRTIGNQAVQRLMKSGALQAKLRIGQPGDIYEQEADRLAGQVMAMAQPRVQRQPVEKEEEEQVQAKPLAEQGTPLVQRQVEEGEEEEAVQMKGCSGPVREVAPNLELRIHALRSGQPLPESTRAFFEPRFGCDFRHVQVHTGGPAARLARTVNARAFTVGRNLVFGSGQYAPDTRAGRQLLAHELTHVVQQRASTALLQRQADEGIREELPVPELPPIFGSGKLSYTYAGKKALKGANARWEGVPDIKKHVAKKGGQWYGVLDKFDMNAQYWLNTKTKWNHIKDFPGGAYNPNFNTPGGSRAHEKAELKAVKTLWENAQKNIKGGIKKGFKTKKEATDAFNKVYKKQVTQFAKKQQAISNHSNPVGPNAEWDYYKRESARYKASLKKKAPKKKGP
jgi:hypothetical protein